VLLGVALICSVLVSVSAINLRPIQLQNQLLERYRNIVALTGLLAPDASPDDDAVLAVVEQLDMRVVNLDTGAFEPDIAPATVDARAASSDPDQSVAIPAQRDLARIGRRARHQVIYLVWRDEVLDRVILPIHGQGMWSTLFGFLALEADLNTIAAVTFYEQAETAGLGDQIEDRAWQARWTGRRLFGSRGELRFRIAAGVVEDGTPAAAHEVDGLSGATVTAGAVTNLVRFWFGEDGYGPLLTELAARAPARPPMISTGD
jgi:Na+-transporting NADH:ubiquinone oxidoreductase subunit C